jgi:hypothetical protein
MTTAGPEPIDNVQHPLDREHYVDKQVRPVAEPVLATLGLDFERAIGDRIAGSWISCRDRVRRTSLVAALASDRPDGRRPV